MRATITRYTSTSALIRHAVAFTDLPARAQRRVLEAFVRVQSQKHQLAAAQPYDEYALLGAIEHAAAIADYICNSQCRVRTIPRRQYWNAVSARVANTRLEPR